MTKFICRNCNYRFETEGARSVCPYCSTGGFEKEKTADELINEVASVT
ncbi:MAG: hypothetical protein AABX65_04365 [Nanoarchaeota archaeon]